MEDIEMLYDKKVNIYKKNQLPKIIDKSKPIFIYLIETRVYCYSRKMYINLYKIGQTRKHPLSRFKNYSNNYNAVYIKPIYIYKSTMSDTEVIKQMNCELIKYKIMTKNGGWTREFFMINNICIKKFVDVLNNIYSTKIYEKMDDT